MHYELQNTPRSFSVFDEIPPFSMVPRYDCGSPMNVYNHSYIVSYERRSHMRTVQLTLDEELVAAVDKTAARLGTTRSGFTRQALRQALAQERERALERKHREGYARKPVRRGEFSAWGAEHAWGES
jgi:predicted transcriptional regulator